MRSGPHIMSPCVPRGVGKSRRRGGKWCKELFTESIGKYMSASNAANKRACMRFFPDGKSHRTSYEYWKLLEQMFPGADKFRTGSLWCQWAHTRASHWDNNCVTMCHNGGHNASLWCQWMLVKKNSSIRAAFVFLDLFCFDRHLLSFLITLIHKHIEIQRYLICFGSFILLAAQTCFVWILMAGHVLSEQICFVRKCCV